MFCARSEVFRRVLGEFGGEFGGFGGELMVFGEVWSVLGYSEWFGLVLK